jgi:hypothetical protein
MGSRWSVRAGICQRLAQRYARVTAMLFVVSFWLIGRKLALMMDVACRWSAGMETSSRSDMETQRVCRKAGTLRRVLRGRSEDSGDVLALLTRRSTSQAHSVVWYVRPFSSHSPTKSGAATKCIRSMMQYVYSGRSWTPRKPCEGSLSNVWKLRIDDLCRTIEEAGTQARRLFDVLAHGPPERINCAEGKFACAR